MFIALPVNRMWWKIRRSGLFSYCENVYYLFWKKWSNMYRIAFNMSGTIIHPASTIRNTTQTAPEAFVEGRKSFMQIFFLKAAEVWFFRTINSFFIFSISWMSLTSLTFVYFGTFTNSQGHIQSPIAVVNQS